MSILRGAAIVATLLLVSCAARQPRAYVPPQCIAKIRWTKPCNPVSSTLVICDGVEVVATCVRYETTTTK